MASKTRARVNPCFAVNDDDGNVIGYWRKYTSFTYEAITSTSLRQAAQNTRTVLFGSKGEAIRYLKGQA